MRDDAVLRRALPLGRGLGRLTGHVDSGSGNRALTISGFLNS